VSNQRPNQLGHEETLIETARKSRRAILAVGGFSVALNVLMLAGPLYMLQVYDRVLVSGSLQTLIALTALIAVLFTGYALIDAIRSSMLVHVAARIEREMAPLVFDAIHRRSLQDSGAKDGRAMKDLAELRQFMAGPTVKAAFDLPLAPLYFLILFLMHWTLGVLALIGSAVIFALALYTQKASEASLLTSGEVSNTGAVFAQNAWRSSESVHALGMQKTVRDRWVDATTEADATAIRASDTINTAAAATRAFRMFLQSALLGAGAVLAIAGVATPGVIIAGSIIGARAITPIEQIVSQWRSIVRARAARKRLASLTGATEQKAAPMTLPAITGKLLVENLFAALPGQQKPFLQAISFSVEPGEIVGVIGASGSGKTTLARVLTGVWPYALGAVRLDGAEIKEYQPDQLGQQLGYLPQAVELLPGTISENIARLRPNADAEKIVAAAKRANAHDMIQSFADGYNTELGIGGERLSAGQRQRIGLARALFSDPKLVILDEPNANLDHEGDEALNDTLKLLKDEKVAVVIIGHRPTTLRHVDKIVLMHEGKVQALGPRDEILSKVLRTQKRSATGIKLIEKGKTS
jgi:ATP-binding cassette, subfamily C, type I secretion system permease/ATPase